MSRAVIVTIELGPGHLEAFAQLGDHQGPAFAFDAPSAAASAGFWQSDECDAIVLELLALMHLPRIDTLVIALPAESVAAASQLLPGRYAGHHVVRNTECRSQTLGVSVRDVVVVALPVQEVQTDGAQPAYD